MISGFNWYESRLKPVAEVLEEKGYTTVFYLSDFDHRSKAYFRNKIKECDYIHVPPYKSNLSVARLFSHMVFGHELGKVLKNESPDLIYCMVPPNSAAPPCLRYKQHHSDCKYYVDLIDLWPESMPIGEGYKQNFIFKKWADLRNKSFLLAEHVFTECDYYQETLKSYLSSDKASTLYLFSEITDEEEVLKYIAKKRESCKENKLMLCYLGSINHLIDIDRICQVISSIVKAGVAVEFRVIGVGETKDKLLQLAEKAGADVKYYGPIYDRSKKLEILGSCDYGFNIMKETVSVGLTIKSVDYFSMGIPIINGIKGDTGAFVDRENVGVNYGENIIRVILDDTKNKSSNAFYCFNKYFTRNAFKQIVYDAMDGI